MKKSILIMFHLLFWILNLLLIPIVSLMVEIGVSMFELTAGIETHMTHFLNDIMLVALIVGACFFYASYFSLPYFLRRQIRFIYLLSAYILLFIVVSLPGYLAAKAGHKFQNHTMGFVSTMLVISPILYFNVFGFLFRTFVEWIKDRKLKAELEKEAIASQMELLKAKINPHFLFNTINNIDVLIQKDAVKASEYLNKLSDILRFVLYETKEEKILLTKELSYIEKYIELQKIRTSNSNFVNYEVKGESGDLLIEPMLFIPFIENAFKHSENKKIENAINIRFDIEKDKIGFQCVNVQSPGTQVTTNPSGLGNKLIDRRLQLLYPGRHTCEVQNINGHYKVNLILSLA